MTKITAYPSAAKLVNSAFLDVSQDSGNGLRSEKVTPLQLINGIIKIGSFTTTGVSQVVTFATAWDLGTTYLLFFADTQGAGIDTPTAITVNGFSIVAGLAGKTINYAAIRLT